MPGTCSSTLPLCHPELGSDQDMPKAGSSSSLDCISCFTAEAVFALWEKHLHVRGENLQAKTSRPTLWDRKATNELQRSG